MPDPRTAPIGKCAGCGFTAPLGIDGNCVSCIWTALTHPGEHPLAGWTFCAVPPHPAARLLAPGERAVGSHIRRG